MSFGVIRFYSHCHNSERPTARLISEDFFMEVNQQTCSLSQSESGKISVPEIEIKHLFILVFT